MSTHETELPFAHNLTSITGEILDGGLQFIESSVLNGVEELQATTRIVNLNIPNSSRKDKVESILSRSAGTLASEIAAYALTHTNIFDRWPDVDKRYLLDRSLSIQILWEQGFTAKYDARDTYYGPTSFGRDNGAQQRIDHLKGLQGKLRQRISPTPPQMRR